MVLALVMTMSLVTIGAGATEYKDLTDKSEIQYEEAVAVLNKLGIITGYEDGSFKPTGALTRGAAAKIIVSLMIGSEAAGNLTVAAAPYKDVPTTNTFAGVISYCKTAGYINGYSDGTFRPAAALTGYAFAKMLLGALGYDGKIEGFSGTGWTMNVARIGNEAGLYNDFKTAFSGNAGITREQACQLAMNTLKATEVEYVGGTSVVAGDASVTINAVRQYKTSNDGKINTNISDKKTGNMNSYATLEFGEDHFRDLKLTSTSTADDFGRPSNKWSYKSVTIGTYAKTADYTFTANGSGDSSLDKLKSLAIDSYKVDDATKIMLNNVNVATGGNTVLGVAGAVLASAPTADSTRSTAKALNTNGTWMDNLTALFGNGVAVQVYINDSYADVIDAIVIVRTEMMEVNSVSSKAVSLKRADDTAPHVNINTVQDTDDVFASLKTLKAEDYVLVTYRWDGSNFVAFSAAVPQSVTGALTSVSRNDKNEVNGVTVGGTAYKLSAVRDDEFVGLTASVLSQTKKDVTLYLDAYGYATYIKDTGSTSNFMIYGDNYQSLVNGKVVTVLTGWDMKGVATSINIGAVSTVPSNYGQLIKYTTAASTTNGADYDVVSTSDKTDPTAPVNGVGGAKGYVDASTATAIKTYSTSIVGDGVVSANDKAYYFASGVKTIFVDFNGGNTVDNIAVKNGVANISTIELGMADKGTTKAQLYINGDGAVEAIVVKTTSSDAISNNTMFVEYVASSQYDATAGTKKYTYNVWVDGVENPDGQIVSTNDVGAKVFVTYVKNADGTYQLKKVNQDTTATSSFRVTLNVLNLRTENKNLIYNVTNATNVAPAYQGKANLSKIDTASWAATDGALTAAVADGSVPTELNLTGAKFADLTNKGFTSLKDLVNSNLVSATDTIYLTIVVNNLTGSENHGDVSQVVLNGFGTKEPTL